MACPPDFMVASVGIIAAKMPRQNVTDDKCPEHPDAPVIQNKEELMPQGDKSSYTQKQKRQAEHIEEGYEKKA